MNNGLRHRLQWLHPVEREVYKSHRVLSVVEGYPANCTRCGSRCGRGDVFYVTRRRGSFFKDTQGHYIHRRCVPTAEFKTAGLPARRLTTSAIKS